MMRRLIGELYYSYVQQPEQLTGRFNKHLSTSLVVFADEAFFAGNKQQQNTLNTFITEKRMPMESKFHDPVQLDSFHRLIMATNHEWVINTALDERRYLVLNVSDKKIQDDAYFHPLLYNLNAEMAGLRFYLENLDISNFNSMNCPKTTALHEQVTMSHDTFDSYWEVAKETPPLCLLSSLSARAGDL
jgi:hypothetical protein